MADASWLKKAPPAPEIGSDEDPFAELTKIMGFDPRVPFRGAQPSLAQSTAQQQSVTQQVTAPHVDLSDDDLDLSIDLERELIGTLEPETAEPAREPMQAAPQPRPHYQGYEQPASQRVAAQDPQARPLDQQAYGDWPSDDADADEAAFAEYTRSEPTKGAEPADEAERVYSAETAYSAEPAYAEPSGVDDDFYTSEDAQAVADDRYRQPGPYAEAQPAEQAQGYDDEIDHAADLVAHLDEELGSSFESDLAADDEDWSAEQLSPYEPEDRDGEDQPREYVSRQPAPDEFAHDFDAAMAEVDMDFTTSAEDAPASLVAAGEAHRAADSSDGFEGDLDSALSDGFMAQAAPSEETPARSDEDFDPEPRAIDEPEELDVHGSGQAAVSGAYSEPAAYETDERAPYEPEDAASLEADELVSFEAEEPVSFEADQQDQQEEVTAEAPASEDAGQSEIDDAIAELAAMVRGFDRPQPAAAPQAADMTSEEFAPTQASDDIPEIETVDVPEEAVALADDLDIPDVDYAEEPAPQFDDLDAELAAAFGEPAIETAQPAPADIRVASENFDLDSGYDASDAERHAAFQAAPYAIAAGAGAAAVHYAQTGRNGDVHAAAQPPQDDYDFQVDSGFDDELAMPDEMEAPQRPTARRGILIASVVGGIAVLGAIGAYAFSGGDGIGSGEPALVKADADPVKVRPENPGGAVVANQDSRVFDRAAGAPASQPEQRELISNEEEPVDVASRFPEALPEPIDESADIDELTDATPKAEDRIEQAIAADKAEPAEETIAVAPRKVRTMIVKSDGTLVPREDTVEPETVGSTTATDSLTDPNISAAPAVPTADLPAPGATPPAASSAQPADAEPAQASAPSEAAQPTEAAQAPAADDAAPAAEAPRAATPSRMPDKVPVAPSRPADQPLDIVGEVKPDQVAALQPAAGAAAAGSWSMQIASQPSEAAAQSTYRDLARRYASVLEGRTANIVKADIAGKGTFWRVRVPAGSRNEAIKLCESYKAAGGNCFVSK